ncbi:MAG: hypothetical protein IJC83_00670, partial [Oscillospiraceae bacterium]|nr:hypothetical protein [Oscillospiraceae bacterium]
MNYNFNKANPITSFCYIIFALIITFSCQNPIISTFSLISAIVSYFSLHLSTKMIKISVVSSVIIAIANFVLTSRGDSVLFTLFSREFTLEALFYGISSGLMFMATIVWFFVFSQVFPSDKLLYILSPLTPTVALVLTLILRLVPLMIKRLSTITETQKTLQINCDIGTNKKRILRRFDILSTLLMMSVEDCFDISSSMMARGFGTAKFTSAKRYRFHKADFILAIILIL